MRDGSEDVGTDSGESEKAGESGDANVMKYMQCNSERQDEQLILMSKREDLTRAVSRLQLISSHDALVLLKNSFSAPRPQYVLRTSYCWGHDELQIFDGQLRTALSKVCNIALDEEQWLQASLPVRLGGLGIRRVSSLALSAFLASAAGTPSLQARILSKCFVSSYDPLFVSASQRWREITNLPCPLTTGNVRGTVPSQSSIARAYSCARIRHSIAHDC